MSEEREVDTFQLADVPALGGRSRGDTAAPCAAMAAQLAPIAQRIASATRGLDIDEDVTLLRGGPLAEDDPDEDRTTFYSTRSSATDAQIPGGDVS